jgi:voltage-gated sodium channel
MKDNIKNIVESNWFQKTIIALIIFAAIIIGLETSPELYNKFYDELKLLDKIIIYAFAAEALLKMLQHGSKFYRYFYSSWNIFDFIIVVVCFLPGDYHFAAILRLVRILRVLRIISTVPKLQLLVNALIKSIPSMFYVGILLAIHFYIYAVLGVFLWAQNDPSHFKDLPTAVVSLFRIITLEDWTDIMYINMYGSDVFPFESFSNLEAVPSASPVIGAIYFISFVVLGTMIMLNLLIGVIINSMSESQKEILSRRLIKTDEKDEMVELEKELELLESQVSKIKERVSAKVRFKE